MTGCLTRFAAEASVANAPHSVGTVALRLAPADGCGDRHLAFGVKTTLAHVLAHLHTVAAVALCGGVALDLLALSACKRRKVGSFNNPGLVAATALTLVIATVVALPALLSLALAPRPRAR